MVEMEEEKLLELNKNFIESNRKLELTMKKMDKNVDDWLIVEQTERELCKVVLTW